MSEVSSSSSGGIGFAGLLTVLFVALKLCNVIDWTWMWVLAPIWISACLAIIVLSIVFLVLFLVELKKTARGRGK